MTASPTPFYMPGASSPGLGIFSAPVASGKFGTLIYIFNMYLAV
jgi:hypothetical protein